MTGERVAVWQQPYPCKPLRAPEGSQRKKVALTRSEG
jgi:hypothetical protein